ncbi:GNAT family N-acetyltransferase [Novosphingobium panipatense]|uniref:GNAT family N-acetyltransferase n=1 Tax=Novosphingobium TaxID=165696 RepID=UPI001E6273B0|nr:GNAT family N-acetyltransferase [Novosphingobium sp. HII-3]
MGSKVKAEHDCASNGTGRMHCVEWRDMEKRAAEWDSLAARAAEANPFFESWYLLASLRHLPRTRMVKILCFERDGELAGLLPVVRSGRYYRWPLPHISSWLHENCFCGVPLVATGAEQAFWQALLRWADRNPGGALFLHMRGMVLGGPLHEALDAVATETPRQVEVVHAETRAMLASTLSPEAYLETSLSGKKRKELRRQTSRLAEQGTLRVERRTDAADVGEWCTHFLRLERSGWKGRSGSALASAECTSALFRDSLGAAAARGRLERLSLTLDGRPIAMLATFLTPPGAFSFKTAFDEDFSRISPGVLLQRENLQILARRDIEWSDSCAAANHPMIDRLWRERRRIGYVSIAIGSALRRAAFRRLVRAETGRSPVKVV